MGTPWYEQEDILFPTPVCPKLEVRPSLIENARSGVFTHDNIPADTIILEYTGYFIDSRIAKDDELDIAVNVGHKLALIGNCIACKINDNCIFKKVEDKKTVKKMYLNHEIPRYDDKPLNCKFEIYGKGEFARAFIKTTTDIPAESELYLDYGPTYWLPRYKDNNLVDQQLADKYGMQRIKSIAAKVL